MIRVSETSKALGQVKLNQTVTTNFTLFNDGDDSISVNNISSSCGCTVPSISVNPIPTKSSAILTVSFTPGSMGQSVKSVSFNSDGNSTQTLYINATVI